MRREYGRMNGRTDRRMADRRTNERMWMDYGRTDVRKDGCTGWTNGRTDKWLARLYLSQSAKLKVAKVIPAFKNDDKHLITNYRSISVLSFDSRLLDFLNNNDMLISNQFRFLDKHTTYLAILDLSEKISHRIDGKRLLYWNIY